MLTPQVAPDSGKTQKQTSLLCQGGSADGKEKLWIEAKGNGWVSMPLHVPICKVGPITLFGPAVLPQAPHPSRGRKKAASSEQESKDPVYSGVCSSTRVATQGSGVQFNAPHTNTHAPLLANYTLSFQGYLY